MPNFRKITEFKTPADFAAHLLNEKIDLDLVPEVPEGAAARLGQPIEHRGQTLGNRWAILPMEGWDCTPEGAPSELTRRRWLRFATSGAKLIYGTEAAAVSHAGRSNTRQLWIADHTVAAIGALVREMRQAHAERFGTADDLRIGLQLTHSGRFAHPNDDHRLESRTAYCHPLLDKKFGNGPANVVSDEELEQIIREFIHAAELAKQAGFDFVDLKQAHGYLGHELLSAVERPGRFGGSFENRTRFFREIAAGIRERLPGFEISFRLSLFDMIPFEKGPDGVGRPMAWSGPYPYAFGGDGTGFGTDFTEPVAFIKMAQQEFGVDLVCTTIASPYYLPHAQRPAAYPVADGYLPPEDPLIGVARQVQAVAAVKKACPGIKFVSSGLTYLQEFLPNVGEYLLENDLTDFVGIGRMVLSYPELCADSLAGKELDRRRICRTFGDCTSAPRHGLVSGCYPLDAAYKQRPEAALLKAFKAKNQK